MAETSPTLTGSPVRARWRSRWLLAAVVLLAVVLVVLVATPMLVRWLAEDWLRGAGASRAHIANVDFNPFSGVLLVEGLQADGDGRRLQLDHLSVNVDWWPLASRRIYVRAFALRGLRADVHLAGDGAVQAGGVSLPATQAPAGTPAEPLDWAVGLGGLTVDDVNVRVEAETLGGSVDVGAVRVGSASQWQADTPTPVSVQLALDGAALALDAQVWPFAHRPRLTGTLRLDGADLGRYRQILAATGLADVAGLLAADLELDAWLSATDGVRLATRGEVRIADLAAAHGGAVMANREAVVSGTTSIQLPVADDAQMVAFDGSLTLAGLELDAPLPATFGAAEPQALAELRQERVAWQGRLGVSGSGVAALSGRVELGSMRIAAADLVFGLASLSIDGLDATSGEPGVKLDGVTLQDLRLALPAAESAPVVALGSLAVAAVAADTGRADVESVDIDALAIDVQVRKDGSVAIVEALQTLAPAAAEDSADADADAVAVPQAAPAFAWTLGRLGVGGDSRIRITDASVEPQLQTRLQPVTLTVTDLASDGRPAQLQLQAMQGNTSRLVVSGQLQPLAEQRSADLAVELSGFSLPQLSGYVRGYNLDQGRLSVTSQVRIDRDILDVDNRIVIERLKLVARQGDEVPFLSEGLAMPLDTVLDLLRDLDDAIRLQVPVTGNVNAPEFGTGQVVRRALRGALQKSAVSYVKNALQPLGTLIMVGQMAGKAMRPRFEPISFPAGRAELDDIARTYVGSMAALLVERPRLSLTLCGVATEADRAALAATRVPAAVPAADADTVALAEGGTATPVAVVEDAELQALAESRADGVRGGFVNTHGIGPERLYACLPQLEDDADAAPRVDVML